MSTALLTGASTGIGYALSKCFAADRHNLILVARQEHKLKQVAGEFSGQFGVSAKVIVADLAKPDAPQKVADEIQRNSFQIDYLINNISGLINKIGVQSVRFSPRRVATQVARMLQES